MNAHTETSAAGRWLSIGALLSLIVLAAAPRTGAQGLTYDTRTTAEGMTGRRGGAGTQVFQAAHGQFANGNVRFDYTESMMPTGFMGTGHYMIMKNGSGITVFVDPAKREYAEINAAELAQTAAELQKSLGTTVKTEITGVRVNVEDLGAGESIEGYATVKYRITQSYTMKMSIMGHTTESIDKSVFDLWIAPQLDGAMTPTARTPAAGGGAMAELTAQLTAAWGKVRKGVVLRNMMTSETVSDGKTNAHTMTTTVSNIKRGAISPSVFEVPAGFTKTDALTAMTGGMGAKGPRVRKPTP